MCPGDVPDLPLPPRATKTGRQLILSPATAEAISTGAINTGAPATSAPTTATPLGGSVGRSRRSLVGAVASWAGRSGGPVAAGTVTGPVTCNQITATGTGQRLLVLAAGVIAAMVLAALLVIGGIQVIVSVLVPLLPGLLVLALLLLILRVLVFGFRLRRRRGASGRLVVGAAKGLARIVVAPIRVGSSVGHELSTEVRRFRVTEVSGRQVDCELVGELAGAQLQPGDIVDVFGRTTRHATVRVRAVVVTSNRSRITARPAFGFVLARITNVVAVALSAACVIGVAYLLLTR
jgi:hypothetical protein